SPPGVGFDAPPGDEGSPLDGESLDPPLPHATAMVAAHTRPKAERSLGIALSLGAMSVHTQCHMSTSELRGERGGRMGLLDLPRPTSRSFECLVGAVLEIEALFDEGDDLGGIDAAVEDDVRTVLVEHDGAEVPEDADAGFRVLAALVRAAFEIALR